MKKEEKKTILLSKHTMVVCIKFIINLLKCPSATFKGGDCWLLQPATHCGSGGNI